MADIKTQILLDLYISVQLRLVHGSIAWTRPTRPTPILGFTLVASHWWAYLQGKSYHCEFTIQIETLRWGACKVGRISRGEEWLVFK